MSKQYPVQEQSQGSIEKIISSIRKKRDERICDLLKLPALMSFLEEHFAIFALSTVKVEFLKRDLKELQHSSLDLAHYSSLIKQIKESNSDKREDDHPLFIKELKTIFQKYCP